MSTFSPKIRRRARERALQFLFGLEFTKDDWHEVLDDFWTAFETKEAARDYAHVLLDGVHTHRAELDAAIDGALKNWAPERVGRVERNVLRIAVFEMHHCDDVPANVAINEAIEIGRSFGSEEAPGFINGVLDRLKEAERPKSAS